MSSAIPQSDGLKLSKRLDYVDSLHFYLGEAVPGSLDTAPVWRICYVAMSSTGNLTMTWADGNSNFDNVWSNRAALTYS